MKSFIRNLTPRAEFHLVIAISFGLLFFVSLWMAIRHIIHGFKPYHTTDAKQLWLVTYELAAITAVYWIGRIRGWSFAAFGLRISWKLTGAGILLLFATIIVLAFQRGLFGAVGLRGNGRPIVGHLTLPVVILITLVNPAFEEITEVGYVFHTLKRYGKWPAVFASALLRTSLHLYQGFVPASGIMLLGMTFGLAYSRWRQLWPLILVHMVFDFVPLLHLPNTG